MLRALIISVSLFCFIIPAAVVPASGALVTFIPANGSISSLEVMDISESHDGIIAFATTNGLSLYESGWTTIHEKPWEYETGLRSNFIQTSEYDINNDLWLGFSAGVQKYDGAAFTRVGQNEFFYTMDIHDILRDDDTIWIANGNTGLNHLSDGKWEWIRPFSENGPDANYISSMAKDHATGNIILISYSNGIWKSVSDENGNTFSQIPFDTKQYGDKFNVIDYPFGGVILFNKNYVLHYSDSGGITTIINSEMLGYGTSRINDVAITENGIFVIGTNNGLYGICVIGADNRFDGIYDEEIIAHITRNAAGITNNEVTKVFTDSKGRWWFVTKGEAGYYLPDTTVEKIPINIINESMKITFEGSEPSNPIVIPIHYV